MRCTYIYKIFYILYRPSRQFFWHNVYIYIYTEILELHEENKTRIFERSKKANIETKRLVLHNTKEKENYYEDFCNIS